MGGVFPRENKTDKKRDDVWGRIVAALCVARECGCLVCSLSRTFTPKFPIFNFFFCGLQSRCNTEQPRPPPPLLFLPQTSSHTQRAPRETRDCGMSIVILIATHRTYTLPSVHGLRPPAESLGSTEIPYYGFTVLSGPRNTVLRTRRR